MYYYSPLLGPDLHHNQVILGLEPSQLKTIPEPILTSRASTSPDVNKALPSVLQHCRTLQETILFLDFSDVFHTIIIIIIIIIIALLQHKLSQLVCLTPPAGGSQTSSSPACEAG